MTAYSARLQQLSEKSVDKHFDAYADIDWDGFDLDLGNPRWSLPEEGALGGTAWYRQLPEAERALLGLDLAVSQLERGIAFENILSRGLLRFAIGLPADAPEWRYAMHEVIEEGQHQLMFREFIRRTGRRYNGMGRFEQFMSRRVVRYGERFPELFFIFVLGGEAPIDFVQRQALKSATLHPLLRRIVRIHVTEEARHLCFAEAFLRQRVPRLGAYKRARLMFAAPLLLNDMAGQMLRPSKEVVARHGIPKAVLREARGRGRDELTASVRRVRTLCADLGLIRSIARPLWRPLAPAGGSGR